MTSKEFLLGLPTKIKPSVIEGMESNFHLLTWKERVEEVTVQIANEAEVCVDEVLSESQYVVKATDENFKKY
ncbi:MAG: hypothetical protein IPK61_08160 [Saprospiraceae bacterium]|nr:hypothetical protein [Saprospiraceae bacterium]